MSDAQLDALRLALKALEENHKHHIDYDDRGGYYGSALEQTNLDAIAALEAAIG